MPGECVHVLGLGVGPPAWWSPVQASFFLHAEPTTDWGAGTREPGAETVGVKGFPVGHPEEGGLTF